MIIFKGTVGDEDFVQSLVNKGFIDVLISMFDEKEDKNVQVYFIIIKLLILYHLLLYCEIKNMAAIVLGDVNNLIAASNKNSYCGVMDAIESLFSIYIVCLNSVRKRGRY